MCLMLNDVSIVTRSKIMRHHKIISIMIQCKIYVIGSVRQNISREVLMKFNIQRPQDDLHDYKILIRSMTNISINSFIKLLCFNSFYKTIKMIITEHLFKPV